MSSADVVVGLFSLAANLPQTLQVLLAVLWTFREPSLCRHMRRELLRNALLDFTPIIPATACHQRNYVETYTRYRCRCAVQPIYSQYYQYYKVRYGQAYQLDTLVWQ